MKSLVPYHWKYLFCRSKLDKLVLVFFLPWANSLLDPMILVCFWVMNCPLALLQEWLDGIRGTIFWELGKLSFGQTKMPGKSKQNGVSMNTCIFGGSTLVVHTFAACKCLKKSVQRIRYTTCDLTFLDSSPSPKKNRKKKHITLPAKGNTTRPGLQEKLSTVNMSTL